MPACPPTPAAPPWRVRLQQGLLRAWQRRGALARLLWPLTLPYRLLLALHAALYRIGWRRAGVAGVPVLVVGNVIAGGAGKTPVVIALVQHLRARGVRVGVVARGHGRRGHGCLEVTDASLPQEVGDEPHLIHQRCQVPVFVAARRLQAARALCQRYPTIQLIIGDDGLQHRALARDIELLVFDERGIGNGWLLPAGPLREPWPRAADLLLYAGPDQGLGGWSLRRSLEPWALRQDGRRVALHELAAATAQPLLALAGIARPEAFFAGLRAQGLPLAATQALPDHYDFNSWVRSTDKDYTLICTEKDAAKLWQRHPDALAVPLRLEPAADFWCALHALLRQRCQLWLSSEPAPTQEPRHG